MRKPAMQLLTYLAQVRQLPFKSALLLPVHALIMHPSLLTKLRKKHGILRRVIAIIGIAPVAVLVVQSKSTDVWLQVAGRWQKRTIYISSPSHAEERK